MKYVHHFSLRNNIGLLSEGIVKNNKQFELRTMLRWGGLIVLLMLATVPLHAQIVDGPNGPVNARVRGADGTTYLGGSFTGWWSQTGGGAVLGTSDGLVNRSFPEIIGEVKVSVSDGSGGFYIGGYFTSVGGFSRNNLAHIDVNGAVTSWNPNAGGAVIAMVISGSTVYIGGTFTSLCNAPSSCTNQVATTRNYLAAIGTDGNITAWNPNDVGGGINALAISSDGNTVYVGGDVSSLCTAPSSCLSQVATTRNRIAAITSSGNVTSWNPGANNTVYALAISGNTLYVGGKFTGVGGGNGSTTRNKIAAIDTATGSVNSWNPSATSGLNNTVVALAISGNTIYAGGNFTTIGGQNRNRLAALNTAGVATSWNPSPNNVVSALSMSSDGSKVYAGGQFTTIGGVSRNRLAAIGTNGTLDSWAPNANNTVNGLTISGSSIYTSGTFTMVGSVVRNRLLAIASDGSLTNWDPNVNGGVFSLVLSGNTIYAGGSFSTISGTTRNSLAAIGIDGTLGAWNPNANSQVNTLALSGSTVYVGGYFSSIGGVSRNRLAAIGTDGTLASWDPNANSQVLALAINGSTVYAGGDFTLIGASTRNRLAAIGIDGSLSNWNPNAGGNVSALAISGSSVYAGGDFTTIGGSARNRLAAIGIDGTLTSWNPNANGLIRTLATSGNTVYAGGDFTTIGASTRNRLAAIGIDGRLSSWDPNANDLVYSLFISGNTVYTGGVFTSTASQVQTNSTTRFLAKLNALPCSSGVPLTSGIGAHWQMLALPCVPATGTIAGVFGSGTLSNLTTINYATDQTNLAAAEKNGWIIEKKTVGATPAYEPLLSPDLALSVGTGYWIKSYQAPTNGLLSMDGTATPTDVSQAEGCYSVNGCKAITVTTYKATYNRYNLVGNPFPYAIDWTKVRVRVDGSPTTYTPAQAAGVAVGDPLNRATPVISNIVNIWNATSTGYDAFTDVAPYPSTPNLQYFKSFWVNVLPGAFGHTVELLIPAEQSTLSFNQAIPPIEQVAKLDLPWYLAWLDVVVSPAVAAPAVSNHVKPQMLATANDWYIRLKVDNPVTGWSDHNSLLGELMDANIGFDPHDVQEMAPYAAPYLTLVFPKPEWDVNAGDYASDFHRFNLKVQTWNFEVRAKPIGSKVFLSWEGSPALLKRSRLIEIATGKIILPSDPRWKAKGYPIKLTNAVQKYTWKVLAP